MKVRWTAEVGGPISRVSSAGAHIVVTLTSGGRSYLDRDGRAVPTVESAEATDPRTACPEPWSVLARACQVHALLGGAPCELFLTPSPVTSVAYIGDELIVAGTRAGTVWCLAPSVSAALLADEMAIVDLPPARRHGRAVALYGAGPAPVAVRRLRHLADAGVLTDVDGIIAAIAGRAAHELHADPFAAFEAAEALRCCAKQAAAVAFYQTAARVEELAPEALLAAADCLRTVGAVAAAETSHRRSASCGPSEIDKEIIYAEADRLARQHLTGEAASHFEMLLSWDAAYRDVWERLVACRETDAGRGEAAAEADWAVSIVSELDRRGLLAATHRTIEAYDAVFYSQFDHSSPSDWAKKHLEMVNLFAVAEPASVRRSLDVGSGTMRYPQVLGAFGVDSFGIDLRDHGVRSLVAPWWRNRFAVGDGCAMPFRDESFDLVTCMMGTINHFGRHDRGRFFGEVRRILRRGGRLVVSAWDPRCAFQGFLSMYSPPELVQLRPNLMLPDELAAQAMAEGLTAVVTTPFCLLPDWFTEGSHLPQSRQGALAALVSLDDSLRLRDPRRVGQMFMLSVRRDVVA